MIPIQFKGNETDVVQQLYNDLINEKLKNKYKSEINEINDWCIKNRLNRYIGDLLIYSTLIMSI